jgi:CrcB protein
MTGFCGGYTTFSTFSALSFRSIYDGDWNDALLNIIGSLVLGLAAVFAGYFVSTITGKLMETWAHRLQRRRKKW